MKLVLTSLLVAVLVTAVGGNAAVRPAVQPGQSWDAACEAAAPGDVIPLAAGTHPPQSISCRKSAPGVVFRPVAGANVVVGKAGQQQNCLTLGGSTHVTVEGVSTTTYTYGGKPGQCGVSTGRGDAHHLTLKDVDAGAIFVAANDVQILGGDYGPTADVDGRISDRTCSRTDFSCMPQRVLIDGAVFHDHRRVSDHMQCISLDGGNYVTIRNTRFYNCAVFGIFVSGPSAARFGPLTFENNVFERGPESSAALVKFSDHGAQYKSVVMRNSQFVGDDLLVSSRSSSDYSLQGVSGPINVSGACSNCGTGTHYVGSTVVAIGGSATPPPPPPGNSAPNACFTRTPNPSRAGQAVTFSASCSSDPDGDALTYAWDISPGGDGVYERSGPSTQYAYGSAGTKTARLRVDDGHGNVVTTTQTFTVSS